MSISDENEPFETDAALDKLPFEPLLFDEPASVVTKTLPPDTVPANVDKLAWDAESLTDKVLDETISTCTSLPDTQPPNEARSEFVTAIGLELTTSTCTSLPDTHPPRDVRLALDTAMVGAVTISTCSSLPLTHPLSPVVLVAIDDNED